MSKNIYLYKTVEQKKVVVTGMAAITPLGLNLKESWNHILQGHSGIDKITQFDASDLDSQIAGEVKNFRPEDHIPKKEIKKMGRFIQLSLPCAREAVKDSGLDINKDNSQRIGVIMGVGIGGLPEIEAQYNIAMNKGARRISPFCIPSVIANLAPGHISIDLKAEGPNYSIASACASGCHAISDATQLIRNHVCDVVITGGVESSISMLGSAGFGNMRALSTRNDQPQLASRPWDKNRDGFVLSEGSAVLVIESYEHAAKRGAKIYAEIKGSGFSSDAYHITSPSPNGEGASLAMYLALKDAGLNKEEIDYINAHGTSTPTGDAIETIAIKNTFLDYAKQMWLSSTKSMTGHTLGAAGAIESVFSILSLKENVAPPTINLEEPSEDCDLDYVPIVTREKKMTHVMNNSFGFGGTNACLVFSKI